jgi:putative ABC transport system substrate-binding protein
MGGIKRRDVLGLLGGGAAWPVVARAQQPIASIGFLLGAQLDDRLFAAFRRGLRDTGYTDGRNVAIKYRSADGQFGRLSQLASELIGDGVAVIVATNPPAALSAKSETAVIPLVFVIGSDPVDIGLVSNLPRPEGNITGVTFLVKTLTGKRLGLLRELVPRAMTVGFLINASNPATESELREAQQAAAALKVELTVRTASSDSEFASAFDAFALQPVNAVLVGADAFYLSRREQIVGLAARHGLPAIYHLRELSFAGGLMSYGVDIAGAFQLAGTYVGRILNGEKVADLPVQQSTRFELIVNLRTAKALGLDVPPTLLALADEVIE